METIVKKYNSATKSYPTATKAELKYIEEIKKLLADCTFTHGSTINAAVKIVNGVYKVYVWSANYSDYSKSKLTSNDVKWFEFEKAKKGWNIFYCELGNYGYPTTKKQIYFKK